MSPRFETTRLGRLGLLAVFLVCVSGEKVTNSRTGTLQELRAALADLAGDGRSYLGRVAGEQTLVSVQKAFTQVLGVVAGSLASGANVLLHYVSHFLETAGVQVRVPINQVTPEGVVFVVQWLLVALIGYWLISLVLRLVASTLRRTLWLLKMALALACFALILTDYRVGTETMAIRLTVLVCVCVLLGVGTSGAATAADNTARLEEQVRTLEKRLRDMERWTRTEG